MCNQIDAITRRTFGLSLCGGPLSLLLNAQEAEAMPWNQPAKIARVYLAGEAHWPMPTLNVAAEIKEIEAGLAPEEAKRLSPVHGSGCKNCSDTGFKGRVAVYEVMALKEELKEFVLNGASSLELKREAIRLGMKTLRRSALEKFSEGVTTLSEVLRVSTADS